MAPKYTCRGGAHQSSCITSCNRPGTMHHVTGLSLHAPPPQFTLVCGTEVLLRRCSSALPTACGTQWPNKVCESAECWIGGSCLQMRRLRQVMHRLRHAGQGNGLQATNQPTTHVGRAGTTLRPARLAVRAAAGKKEASKPSKSLQYGTDWYSKTRELSRPRTGREEMGKSGRARVTGLCMEWMREQPSPW